MVTTIGCTKDQSQGYLRLKHTSARAVIAVTATPTCPWAGLNCVSDACKRCQVHKSRPIRTHCAAALLHAACCSFQSQNTIRLPVQTSTYHNCQCHLKACSVVHITTLRTLCAWFRAKLHATPVLPAFIALCCASRHGARSMLAHWPAGCVPAVRMVALH